MILDSNGDISDPVPISGEGDDMRTVRLGHSGAEMANLGQLAESLAALDVNLTDEQLAAPTDAGEV